MTNNVVLDEFQMLKGLGIIDGKLAYAEESLLKPSQTINEAKIFEDAVEDQIGKLVKLVNSLVLCTNQHVLMMGKLSKQIDGFNPMKSELEKVRDRVTITEKSIQGIETGIKESNESQSKEKEELIKFQENTESKDLERKIKLESLEFRIQEERTTQDKARNKERREREDEHEKVWKKLAAVEEKMGVVEKETVWQISDFKELLRLRPTTEVVQSMVSDSIKQIIEGRPKSGSKGSVDLPNELAGPSVQEVNSLMSKVSILENK